MNEKRPFQTTTTAEFREIAKTAQAGGRLGELIKALAGRIDRHRAMLELHETARDFQQIRETRKVIANLESKLEIARKLVSANVDEAPPD
jgi:hypothetical protein